MRPTSVKIVSTAGDKTSSQDHIAGGSESHRAPYDGSGRPSGPRPSRIGIGPVRLGKLKVGEYRELTREELGGLLDLTGG